MGKCRVVFQPGDREVVVDAGTDLLTAAISIGVELANRCAGEGACGACKVVVRDGEVTTEPSQWLTDEERQAGYVLACRSAVQGDVQVEVPPESRVEREQILMEGVESAYRFFTQIEEVGKCADLAEPASFVASPLTAKLFLELPPPTVSDNISDLERFYRGIRQSGGFRQVHMSLAEVRKLGKLLRASDWQVTATLGRRDGAVEVVRVDPGDTSQRHYGIAVDIGTTTVVASLVQLQNGQTLGTKATHNRQVLHGPDVITRIIYAEKKEGLEKLHRVVVDTIGELIDALLDENGIAPHEVSALCCAGNTTMTHLLLRISPAYIRRAPYVPTINQVPSIRPDELGLKLNPRGVLACLPGVSSYVGGDITAGVLASGIDVAEKPCMLIDLGTNGEIVLGNREWLVCCSASAGTAFEGKGVRCGARAVQRVEIDPRSLEVTYETVGGGPPMGVCGSGFIDLLGALFRCGIIDRQGRIQADMSTPRVRQGRDGAEFVVVWAAESGTGRDIAITQAGIDNLIRAKGAVYSAAKVLVDKMGMTFEDVDRIYIGGGFGNYLNIEKSIKIGLLPDLPVERFSFIGNSSLAGAKIALRSYEAMTKVQEIAGRMTNIELCEEPTYMGEYVGALFLPHTDIDLFPTVKKELEEDNACPVPSL